MIITIGGTPGSGKSSVGIRISERLGLKRYYMGQVLRDKAREKGMTLQEYLESGEEDDSVDREVDEYQRDLGENSDDFVIEGRTSFIMIPHAIKVFLKTDLDTAARRIFNDMKEKAKERNEGMVESFEQMKAELERRMRTDRKRYHKYYGVDAFDEKNFDIVVDTTDISIDQAVETVLQRIRALDQ